MAKILLVDDDEMNGTLLQKRLAKRDVVCDFVTSGSACFEALEKEEYELLLLDIMMPDMNGTEVLQKIRETKNNIQMPVIMVTAKSDASDVVDALKLDANDYLTKPVNIDIAIARINTQLRVKKLIEESIASQQVETINKMVTTLNHEINNPLAIAIGNLSISTVKLDPIRIEKAMEALNRITEIVKKIEQITSGEMEVVDYSSNTSMFKI